jgi:hypothetical protein
MTRLAQTVVAKGTVNPKLCESTRNGRTNNRNVTLLSYGVHLSMKTAEWTKQASIIDQELRNEFGWKWRDTAGDWTWRDDFVVHLWSPIVIHGKIVVF